MERVAANEIRLYIYIFPFFFFTLVMLLLAIFMPFAVEKNASLTCGTRTLFAVKKGAKCAVKLVSYDIEKFIATFYNGMCTQNVHTHTQTRSI